MINPNSHLYRIKINLIHNIYLIMGESNLFIININHIDYLNRTKIGEIYND
jgi:hypothetical protein